MRTPLAILFLVLAAAVAGCVERQMTLVTHPEGALVEVSSVQVGRGPVTMPFTWYGDYDITISKEGYETLKTHAYITQPWYEVIPLDLFSAMAPWTYHDHRELSFQLRKLETPSDSVLIKRAEEMRKQNAVPVEP